LQGLKNYSSSSLRGLSILCILAMLAACQTALTPVPPVLPAATTQAVSASTQAVSTPTQADSAPTSAAPLYKEASQPVEKRVEDLLARMTLDEKIGQMIQIEHPSLAPA
jgi:hypothetical protein